MRQISIACWGYSGPALPDDVPEDWNPTAAIAKPVELVINGGIEGLFRAQMFPLAPYRVPGVGVDLWLLPLVDHRYKYVHLVNDTAFDLFSTGWQALFDELANTTLPADPVPEAYGKPDPRLLDTQQPQLSVEVLDVAVLSVGLRIVCDPATGILRALNQVNSAKRRDATLGFTVNQTTGEVSGSTSPRLIAGGKRGKAAIPSHIDVYCQRDGDWVKRSHALTGGIAFHRLPIWTTFEAMASGPVPGYPDGQVGTPYNYSASVSGSGGHSAANLPPGLTINSTTGVIDGTPTTAGTYEVTINRTGGSATLTIVIQDDNEAKTDAFVEQLATDIASWANSGGQYCFAGPIPYLPSGYDDYLSIELFETDAATDLCGGDQESEPSYIFRSRIYELPAMFVPAVVLCNGEEPECSRKELYRFEMTEDIANGDGGETPPSTIITNFPKDKTITSEAILVNVDGMIDYARAGFVGECKYEAGKYWFVQAACGQICESGTSIPAQTPYNAKIGDTAYAWTPTVVGTVNAGSWAATGLPTNWAINATTGQITGPGPSAGVLGPESSIEITLTCTGPKIAPAVGNCTATRKVTIRIVGA
jgi:hypothetical protein